MSKNAVSPNDDWEAREDAHTLARHHEIHSDPKRHAKAIKAAQQMADDKIKEAECMKRVATSSPHSEKKTHSSGVPIVDSKVREV